MNEDNPYADVTDFLTAQHERDLRIAGKAASDINPDQAGKNAELADRTGLPKDLVGRKYDEVKQANDQLSVDYTRISANPGFAKWMSDPGNFAIAQDDLQNAHTLEWLFTAPVKAFNQGTAQTVFGYARYDSMFHKPDAAGLANLDTLRKQMREGGDLGVESFGGGMITGAASFIPQLTGGLYSGARIGAPAALGAGGAAMVGGPFSPITVPAAAALGYTAGSIAGMAEFGFKQEAGHAYEEFMNMKDTDGRPMDPDLAKVAALAAGGLNAGLEAVQLRLIMKMVPGMGAVTSTPARAVVREALQIPTIRAALMNLAKQYSGWITQEVGIEVMQRAVVIVSGEMTKAVSDGNFTHRTSPDIGADLVQEGVGAFQSFALAGVPGTAIHGIHEVGDVRQAKAREKLFLDIGKQMAESKVLKRYPGAAEGMVESMIQGTDFNDVYIDPQAFTEYFQSKKLDPKMVAQEIMGDTVEYDNALQTGHDMAIPVPIYAARIAPTEHNAFFAKELRFEPESMNLREAQEFEQSLKKEADQVTADRKSHGDQISEEVAAQLEASGFERKAAQTLATQMRAFFETQAMNTQQKSVMDLFKQYVLRIAPGDVPNQGGMVLNQPAYHGSGAEFEKFDLQKIGSGEGNQAYGWGLYFASNKKIAEYYKDQMTRDSGATIGGLPWQDVSRNAMNTMPNNGVGAATAHAYLSDQLVEGAGIDEAIKMNESWLSAMSEDLPQYVYAHKQAAVILKQWKDAGFKLNRKKGRLYTVDIPDTEKFLDYDAGQNVQPPAVQKLMDQMQEYADVQFDRLVQDAQRISKSLLAAISQYSTEAKKKWTVMQRGDFDSHAVYDADLKRVSPVFKDTTTNTSLHQAEDWLAMQKMVSKDVDAIVDNLRQLMENDTRDTDAADLSGTLNQTIEMITDSFSDDSVLFKTREWKQFADLDHRAETFAVLSDSITTGQGLYQYITELASDKNTANPVSDWLDSQNMNIKDAYHFTVASAEEAASKFLLAHDIPGLKYLDGSSRSRQNKLGNHNYVAFDDTNIKITSYEQSPRNNPFPDSKVKEMVYHGTNYSFDKFSKRSVGKNHGSLSSGGFFFTSSAAMASEYAETRGQKGSNIIPAFINLRNPIVVDTTSRKSLNKFDQESELSPNDYNAEEFIEQVIIGADTPEHGKSVIDNYKKSGVDGLIIKDSNHTVYMVFDNDQIASAISGDLMQRKDSGPLGKMIKYGDYEFDIRMLDNANLSTFLHESGHLYLEILLNLRKEGKASEQMNKDFDALMEYLGVGPDKVIKTEHHEKFAESLEQYFMEGKAPSESLRLAFARFKVWLVALYGKYVNAGIRLNDDVRAIFDRMFATQQEIDAAKGQAGIRPLFTTAADVGMSDAEFKNYIKTVETANVKTTDALQQKLVNQYVREKKQWWKDESDKIAAQIREEWKSDPGHQALAMLSEGVVQEGQDPIKLDGPALIAEFGKAKDNPKVETMKTLDAYRTSGGVHHNVVAETFGFKGGEQLMDALIRAKTEQKGLRDRVEAEMVARHGDMMKDGTLHEAAIEAVANDHQAAVIHAEMKALIRKRNEVHPFVTEVRTTERKNVSAGVAMVRGVPPLSVFQRTAKDRIAATTIRQLHPSVYLTAARVAANQAIEAMGRKDYTIAAMAKQRQLMNLEMYRVARNALDEVESIVKYVNGFNRPSVRQRISAAGHDYMDQIDALMDRFDFRPMSQATERKRDSLKEWLDVKARDGQEVDLPKEIVAEAHRRSYKSLTVDELTGIRDVLKHIEHLSSTKNKLMRAGEERRLDVLRNLLVDSVAQNTRPREKASASTHAPQDTGKKLFTSWLASHRKLSSFARQLDGFKDGGTAWELFVRPFNAAADAKVRMLEELGPKMKDLFVQYQAFMDTMKSQVTVASQGLVEMGMYKRELIPAIDDSLSMMERLMVASNMGNTDNYTKLKAGHNWNDDQVREIVDPLTKADWDFVQNTWDLINSYWGQINAKHERVNGIGLVKVEAVPFQTKYGEYKGGYMPLKYNDELSTKSYAHRAAEMAKDMERGWFTRSTTRRGFTNERVEGVKEPVRLDFGIIFEHLHDVIHDLTHHETLIDVNRILGASDVQRSIIGAIGHQAYREMQETVKSIAAGDIPARGAFERNMNWLRSGVAVAAMGWNVVTGLMQPLGIFQSIVRVGPEWVAKGVAKWIGDAATMENTVAWIYSVSTTMRNRGHTQTREVSELRNSLEGRAGTNTFRNTFYYFLTKGQMLVDVPTWLGAYEKGMDQFAGDEAKAIALADQAVLDSQGGGDVKDMASIQRGGPMKKLFTVFYSYFNATYNQASESVGRARLNRDVISVGRAAVDLLLLYSFPAVLGYMIKDAVRGHNPGDDDDFWARMTREQLSFLAGSMVGPRELASVIQGYYGYEGPAGTRFYSQMANMMKQIDQGEVDEALVRSINNVAGILFHYPAAQLDKMARGYVAWSENNDTPLALVFGPSKE